MQTWLSLEEYAAISGKSKKEIIKECKEKKLNCKKQDKTIYIEAFSKLVPLEELKVENNDIAQKTISMLLTLHEKVLMSKEETLKTLKEENEFLKYSVYSIQEVYESSQETIKRLQKQLEICQEELEFCKRKYKLMWGRVLDQQKEE
jgi:hypothetical protein